MHELRRHPDAALRQHHPRPLVGLDAQHAFAHVDQLALAMLVRRPLVARIALEQRERRPLDPVGVDEGLVAESLALAVA